MVLADAFGDFVYGLVVLAFIVALYFAPTIVAFAREVPNKWSIAVINAFLGWTLVGWVVALAMAARSVPRQEVAAPGHERACPNCKGAMGRAASACPHCGHASTPWIFHAGVWWMKGRESNEWQWVDDDAHVWRYYKDGTPSDPAAIDKTANLRIDPAIVKPPDPYPIETSAIATDAPPPRDSFAGELERLADLHARGALTDEQFEAAKARLLTT